MGDEMNAQPTVPAPVLLMQGKQIAECPPNFRVVMKVQAQDGTVYAAGYIQEHHPKGVPQALTFRRITLKRGEQRRIDNELKEVFG
jgi:hypothetical protein